jgi:hypothetical protein
MHIFKILIILSLIVNISCASSRFMILSPSIALNEATGSDDPFSFNIGAEIFFPLSIKSSAIGVSMSETLMGPGSGEVYNLVSARYFGMYSPFVDAYITDRWTKQLTVGVGHSYFNGSFNRTHVFGYGVDIFIENYVKGNIRYGIKYQQASLRSDEGGRWPLNMINLYIGVPF